MKQWNVSFLDNRHNKVNVNIKLTDNRLSMSGEYAGHLGQIVNQIVPANSTQKELVELWEKWHLNDCHAGTKKQKQILNKYYCKNPDTSDDYNTKCNVLDIHNTKGKLIDTVQLYSISSKIDQLNQETTEFKIITEENVKKLEDISKDIGKNKYISLSYFKPFTVKQMGFKKQDLINNNYVYIEDTGFTFKLIIRKYSELIKNKMDKFKSKIEQLQLKTSLYEKLEDGTIYKYGSSWLTRELPKDIEQQINNIIVNIEEEEIERIKDEVLVNDLVNEKSELLNVYFNIDIAIAMHFDLTLNEMELDIEDRGNHLFTVQGISYIIGTDEELNVLWEERLKDYIDECILPELPESYRMYFDEEYWISDAKIDGRAHVLNNYDGNEESVEYNNTWYYIYRQ